MDLATSLKVGTLGFGIDVTTKIVDDLNIRLGTNYFKYKYNGSEEDVDYNVDLKLQSTSLLLDWHPFSGDFRISGGMYYNGNKFDLKAKPLNGATYEINGVTYTTSDIQSLNGGIDFDKYAPYLGIGMGNSLGKNKTWTFVTDLGVMFQGKPKAHLNVNCDSSLNATQCNILKNDVLAEEQELNDSVKKFKIYPVASFGLAYKF